MNQDTNDQMALICGLSATGKSASLRNLKDQKKWFYLNTEAGKRLPFKNDFHTYRIEDPYQVHEAFDHFTKDDDIIGGIVDSVTFMMDMFETMYIYGNSNTQKAWGDYQQFFKALMQQKVVSFGKPVLMTAHTLAAYNESTLSTEVAVPVKGALKNNGIESYFSTVVAAKKMTLKDLEGYESDLLTITEDDEMLGYKHVFQTRPTKQTIGERIRSPLGMFTRDETFMDNDAQKLLDKLHAFYA
jgi:hypothetical protein